MAARGEDRELTPKQAAFVQEYLIDLNATQAAIRAGVELPRCVAPKGFYVYALVDPRDSSLFYIGKGRGMRYAAHYDEWKSGVVVNPAKFERIGEIVQSGRLPIPVCFAEGLTEPDAYALERQLIDRIGVALLTNIAPGQSSEVEKVAVKARDLLGRVKPFEQWCAERLRSIPDRVMYFDIVEHLRMVAAGRWL